MTTRVSDIDTPVENLVFTNYTFPTSIYFSYEDLGDGKVKVTRLQLEPSEGYAESFTYTVSDGEYSDTGTVAVSSEFPPDPDPDPNHRIININDEEDVVLPPYLINVSENNDYEWVFKTNLSNGIIDIDLDSSGYYTMEYKPNQDYFGTDKAVIEFKHKNNDDVLYTVTFNIVLAPVNDAPEFVSGTVEEITFDEDTTFQFDVEFFDVDNDDLVFGYRFEDYSPANKPVILDGGVEIIKDPLDPNKLTIKLSPVADAFGTAKLVLYVSDGLIVTEHEILIEVISVNDAPVAEDAKVYTAKNNDVNFNLIKANSDIDSPRSGLTVVIKTAPNKGDVVVNPDGSVTYTPNIDFVGTDIFTYVINDNDETDIDSNNHNLDSNVATVEVYVSGSNYIPEIVGLPSVITMNEDTTHQVEFRVIDKDNDILSYTLNDITGVGLTIFGETGITLTYNAVTDRYIINLVPLQDMFGNYQITFTVSDGKNTVSKTSEIRVLPVNDLPVAEDDLFDEGSNVNILEEDTFIIISPLVNDHDVEDGLNGLGLKIFWVNQPANGKAVIINNRQIKYTPNQDYFGLDEFKYKIIDSDGGISNEATISVKITPVNDAPILSDVSFSTDEDVPLNGEVIAYDVDNTDEQLTYSLVSEVAGVTWPQNGSVVVNADGTFIYTPNQDYNGQDYFYVKVFDGELDDTGKVTITVKPVNDAPEITLIDSEPWTFDEDTIGVFRFKATDIESPSKNLIVMVQSNNQSIIQNSSIQLSIDPSDDDIRIITLNPIRDANGSLKIIIRVDDGDLIVIKEVEVYVTPVNDDPILTVNNFTMYEDTTYNGKATATDVDGDPLTFAIDVDPNYGTVTINSTTGNFSYTPIANYNGTDQFTISVSDGTKTISKVVIVTIRAVNDIPTLTVVDLITPEDTAVNGAAVGNDVDLDPNLNNPVIDSLTYSISKQGKYGTATIDQDGNYTYTPKPNFNGEDTFIVRLADSFGGVIKNSNSNSNTC